ncbi:CrcB-like protein-domain-containing protein [Melampsora americana]|nr:CrcB-like protein-domain-containing protein [Melampsora americana]
MKQLQPGSPRGSKDTQPQPIEPLLDSTRQLPSPFKSQDDAPPHEQKKTTPIPSRILETHSILIWWAICGLLTRLGLNAIGEYEGRSVFSVLLVQVVGCLVMGMGLRLKDTLDRIHPLLYLGLTIGYCGSVTTFSTWMIQVFQAFSNNSALHRSRFHSFLDGFNQTYITVSMSIISIQCGLQLANLIEPHLCSFLERFSSPSSPSLDRVDSCFTRWSILLIGPIAWISTVFLFFYGPHWWRGPVSYSLLIGPIGTLTRYHLSKLNSFPISTRNGFPIGTFLANLMATALLAVFTLLQLLPQASKNAELCGSLQGLKDGFCGCLSTISTFTVELLKIKPTREAIRYGILSWMAGQLVCVLLLGIYLWTRPVLEHCHFPT